jgi:hypothetical protein
MLIEIYPRQLKVARNTPNDGRTPGTTTMTSDKAPASQVHMQLHNTNVLGAVLFCCL